MEANRFENLEVYEQAAYWLCAMQDPSPDEQAAFWAWIRSSPIHVREFLLAGKLDQELESFDHARRIDIEALLLKGSSQASAQDLASSKSTEKRRLAPRWFAGIAASAALIALAAFLTHTVKEARSTYVTQLGEQRLLDLEDGSVIFLNTQSRLKVRYTAQARDVYLEDGQVLFRVRHDATRPFRVHARNAVIQAIGTQFDVRVFSDRTTVAVVEGTVQLLASDAPTSTGPAHRTTSPSPPNVTAGEGATIDASGAIEPVKKIDTDLVVAWSQQRLVFKGETLDHIATEFNRYNVVPKLRVEGETLRERSFIGVFDAHNPGSLLEYLRQDGSVTFVREGDEVILRPAG